MASIDSGVETGNESNDSPVALECSKDNSMSVVPAYSNETSRFEHIFSAKGASLSFDFKRFSNLPENTPLGRGSLNHGEPKSVTFRYPNLNPDVFRIEKLPLLPMIEDKSCGGSSSSSNDGSGTSSSSQLEQLYAEYARDHHQKSPSRRIRSANRACRYRAYHRNPEVVVSAYSGSNNSRFSREISLSKERRSQVQSLFLAAQLNDVDRVRNLLLSGVPINVFDSQWRTPLHLAACKGYAQVVKLLLVFGADPGLRDGVGNTALHLAVCTNHLEVVSLLLKAGIDVCSSDFKGRSPLQLAQSKLKILQRSQDIDNIKSQVIQVIDMLMSFINKNRNPTVEDLDFLTSFQNKFKISDSPEQVGSDIKDLLAKLDNLSVSPTASNNNL